jgi:hypothetical protein
MWNLLKAIWRPKHDEHPQLNSNATLIDSEHLLILYGQSAEKLTLFDLRQKDDIDRFPFMIPGALLTTSANVLDLIDWIPPQAIVVLYGAEKISAHADLIASLPADAHFYLLEGGIKSWRIAKFPMEPIEELLPSEAPAVWARNSHGPIDGENWHV